MRLSDLSPKWAKTSRTRRYIRRVNVISVKVENVDGLAFVTATHAHNDGKNEEVYVSSFDIGLVYVCLEKAV